MRSGPIKSVYLSEQIDRYKSLFGGGRASFRSDLHRQGRKMAVSWRTKFVFILVVYFAGFATAVYCLAPVPADAGQNQQKSFASSIVKSDEFAQSFNQRMHRCLSFTKDMALSAGEFIRQRFDARKDNG